MPVKQALSEIGIPHFSITIPAHLSAAQRVFSSMIQIEKAHDTNLIDIISADYGEYALYLHTYRLYNAYYKQSGLCQKY